jgi:hypothetical protein
MKTQMGNSRKRAEVMIGRDFFEEIRLADEGERRGLRRRRCGTRKLWQIQHQDNGRGGLTGCNRCFPKTSGWCQEVGATEGSFGLEISQIVFNMSVELMPSIHKLLADCRQGRDVLKRYSLGRRRVLMVQQIIEEPPSS